MIHRNLIIIGMFFGLVLFSSSAHAELFRVSPGVAADGKPEIVTVFPPAPWDPLAQELTGEGDFRGAGFPIWYQDTNGLRLTLCLDGEEEEFPCAWEGAPVFTDAQCTEHFYKYEEVVGFGDEGFYFKAQSFPFDVPLTGPANGGFAQMQLLLETTWGEDERFDPNTATVGNQLIYIEEEDGSCVLALGADLHRVEPGYEMLFARSRLRVLPGSPEGWYRMTYPYGVKTIYHPFDPDDDPATRRTEIRQVVGDLRVIPEDGRAEMQDFTIALNDPQALIDRFGFDEALASYIGLRDTGFINDEEAGLKSIGPFLYKPDFRTDPAMKWENENGEVFQFIGRPANEADPAASPGHKVLGSAIEDASHESGFRNFFRIEYQACPQQDHPNPEVRRCGLEVLEANGWEVVGYTDEFNVVGKIFNPGSTTLSPGVYVPLLFDEEEEIAR